jgi:DNA invertase Pin-like site-specific DNA recombinase
MSGTVLYRPQLTQLRTLVAQHLIQAVIVYDADRLSRVLAHTLFLRDECHQAGVVLHVVTAPSRDMSPEGQLQANILATFAEFERLKILRRTEDGRRRRVKAGYVPGGRTYGYRQAGSFSSPVQYRSSAMPPSAGLQNGGRPPPCWCNLPSA